MSDQNEPKRPSHIAYQVREGEGQKSYFNRVGSAWPHKDGEGYNIHLDSMPVDGRITLRTAQDRLQEMRGDKDEQRGKTREGERRESKKEARRESGPRYER